MDGQKKQSGLGISAFVLGIIGMMTTCIVVGIIPCVIGLIFSIIVLCSPKRKKGFAIAGLLCSLIGVAFFTIFLCSANLTAEPTDEKSKTVEEIETESSQEIDNEIKKEKIQAEKKASEERKAEEESRKIEEEKIEKEKAEEERIKKEEEKKKFTYQKQDVKYLKYEIETHDYSDNKYLLVYFEYTNNSNDNQSFQHLFNIQAFQDGIELDDTYIFINDEDKNRSREIKTGVTITVAESFVLNNEQSAVDIEVSPLFSFDVKKLWEYNIELQ